MKFRLPPDCLGLSIGGGPLAVTDGTVEADPGAAAALAAHGVRPLGDAAAEPPARKPRPEKKS